ncbi:MAG TPA: FAD-binding and (Fe-S)-binding domain-containing protein [Acidimicrobiales bacterium]|nr:FAD-binding and (Fe-S)-binding domain-containing protein [Acidimicrobiales bacterium]
MQVLGRPKLRVPAKTDPRVPGGINSTVEIDVADLERDLADAVEGEVRFDSGARAMYANDSSNFRQVPIGVVVPRSLDDVIATHRVCARYRAPILNRGCGTSLSGETVNYAVVIDHSKYLTAIGDIDPSDRSITVQPGAINEHVNIKTGHADLVFGPDPSTHSRCTIGGNIGNNSCGIHSVQSELYGPGPRTSDNVAALEVLTYAGDRFWVGINEEAHLDEIIAAGGAKGRIYAALRDLRDEYAEAIRKRYQPVEKLPRRVSGYNLDELLPERGFNVARALVGTEGTCATVLQAKLLLTPALLHRSTVVIAYDELADAGRHVPEIMGWRPIGLEGLDRRLIEDQQLLHKHVHDLEELPRRHEADAWLLVQFGADDHETVKDQEQRFTDWLRTAGYEQDRVAVLESKQDGGNSEDIWEIREGGLGSTAFPPGQGDHWPGWEDSAVPREAIGDYLRDLKQLYAKHGLRGAFYGHFGQGCIHSRISFDLLTASGVAGYRRFMEEAADLVVSYGGTLSGEHGDGQQRGELLERQYGPELVDAMRKFKAIWDPDWKMNPGKVVDAYRLDEDLKLGVYYNPARPEVRFAYREDGGDFAHATLRCVGVGKCRVPDAQETMCPSFQVTREEAYSTRGRARLLWEMLRGEVITDGWASKEVFEALDLCLACKGCTNDCPVNVDIPTYKAEFLYHHYQSPGRRRPRYAYAFGFIDQAARVAGRFPELANFATSAPGLSRLVKWVGGIDRRRQMPSFAPMSLQEWFARRGGTKNPTGPPVVLFPDTFNNRLHTDVGVACVEAIEDAGWRVIMPEGHICCGRPLYDYGFLDAADAYLRRSLDVLRPHIRQGTPVVGMEPSCLAVFKDELVKMFPHDDDAQRLNQLACHFGEFFDRYDISPPALDAEAVVWGHCHHRATGGIGSEMNVLAGMGVQADEVKGGCCGLAGSWGFEEGKYDVSVDCGEQALLPAVRRADPDAVVVANGFSCSTQIAQTTSKRAVHLGQVMRMAAAGDTSHASLPSRPAPPLGRRVARTAGPVVGAAAAVAAAVAAARR